MADWILIPCLKALFAEFDRIAPSRDRASDGSLGDQAHQHEVSDHNADEVGSVPIHDADHINEVHAIDVDNNLRESDLTMEKVVQFLLGRCRSGAEKRLRYIIYNRRIWSASSGWVQKAYTGASPHTEHAHFSASYETNLEADTSSWHLEDIDMPTAAEIAKAVWEYQFTRPDGPDAHGNKTTSAGAYQAYSDMQANTAASRVITTLSPLIGKAGGVDVDELVAKLAPAVAQLVIAGLPADRDDITPGELQAAIVGAMKELVDRPPA